MRTIKFRGQDDKTGEWVCGGITQHAHLKRTLIFDYDSQKMFSVTPFTVGQFTGWIDGAGNEIYEDDFVQDDHGIGFVAWHDGAFWLKSPGSEAMDLENGDFYKQACVIGNIHDNSELIH